MTPRSKKLLALVTYGISLYARATCESRAQDLACRRKCRIDLAQRLSSSRSGCQLPYSRLTGEVVETVKGARGVQPQVARRKS